MNYQILNGEEIAKGVAAIQNKLAEVFPLANKGVEPFINKRSGVVTFYAEKLTHINNLVAKLVNERNYTLLYYVMGNDGKCYDVALLSDLSEEPMHCFVLHSTQFGLVNNLTACFFDSLDKMYKYSSKLWEASLSLKGIRSEDGIDNIAELTYFFTVL